MARVTVEDCVTKIPNRFQLVMLASQRARNISAGEALNVERDNDKNPVVALREIADDLIDHDELEESLIKGLQKFVEMDDPEEDDVDLIAMVKVRDHQSIADVVTQRINKVPGVLNTATHIAFQSYSSADIEAGFSIGE